jgi:hypothetical protein
MKPGPGSYHGADALKKKVKVLWKYTQPSELEPRISRNLSLSSLKEYAEKRDRMPGPGFYKRTDSYEGFPKPYRNGVPLSRDSSERCKLILGDNVSPGPGKYKAALASHKLNSCSWMIKMPRTFGSSKRPMNLYANDSSHIKVPGPTRYQS